jgi:hypothetical protein
MHIISNRISAVIVSVLASNALDHGFEPRSGQTKHNKIGIAKHYFYMLYVRGDNTYIKFINNGNEIRLQSAPKTTSPMPLSSKNWFGLDQIEKILLKYCSGHRHLGPGFFFFQFYQ